MKSFQEWLRNEALFSKSEKSDVDILAKAMLKLVQEKAKQAGVDPEEVVRSMALKTRSW